LNIPHAGRQVWRSTFHHLIALFSTVAGKEADARGLATIFRNEINDLAAFLTAV
jgi:hypothetical protein